MLKEFIAHIQKTTAPQIIERGPDAFVVNSEGQVKQIHPDLDWPTPLELSSLDALVKMIRCELRPRPDATVFVMIPTHLKVEAFLPPQEALRWQRPLPYFVEATDVPGWDSDKTLGFEDMQIALRTRFQDSRDMPYIQKLLSDITTGGKITCNDNGIATSVVTQKGVALQGTEVIRPIVNMRPYRTFQEVEQPESPFLIRVSERGLRLIASDGGMWKLAARQTVKAFLEEQLADLVSDGSVVIAL